MPTTSVMAGSVPRETGPGHARSREGTAAGPTGRARPAVESANECYRIDRMYCCEMVLMPSGAFGSMTT